MSDPGRAAQIMMACLSHDGPGPDALAWLPEVDWQAVVGRVNAAQAPAPPNKTYLPVVLWWTNQLNRHPQRHRNEGYDLIGL